MCLTLTPHPTRLPTYPPTSHPPPPLLLQGEHEAHLATAAVEMVGQFEELLLRILHPPSLPESEEAASHALVDSPMASGMRNLWASRSRRGARGGAAAGEGGDQTGQVRFKPGSKLTTQD